jgi:hypothetical protein
MSRVILSTVVIAVVGAGCVGAGEAATNSESTANPQCHWGPEWTTSAGSGWVSEFVPQQLGWGAQMQLAVTPQPSATGPIDAVIGFANGRATKFSDLGPILRFNADGKVDARDGSIYRAETTYPYLTDGTQYVLQLRVDFDHHTYSATVGHYYDPNSVTIANNYAFRTEQATMSRADTLARFVDSSSGGLQGCDYAGSAQAHDSSASSGWGVTPFRPQSGIVHVDIVAYTNAQNMDAIVGLASQAPARFSDLAAIARFSPTGVIDARDGDTYRADARVEYVAIESYHLIFDVNVPAKTYDLTVYDSAAGTRVQIAHGYHFRTEQSGASTLSALGQFVDGTPGLLTTEFLLETY